MTTLFELSLPTLSLAGLSYRQGKGCRVSTGPLQFDAGELVAIVGPNGAGKSMFFKALTGEVAACGQVIFLGRDLRQWPTNARARSWGVLPQHTEVGFQFTAREIVNLGALPLRLSQAELRASADACMADCGVLPLADRPLSALSGGERQRVHLARVLLQLSQSPTPPVLMLDEPLSAQDLGQQHQLLALLVGLCKHRRFSVLVVLHDLNQVLRYCHRVLVFAQGRLVGQGEPMSVLTPDFVHEHWAYRPCAITTDHAVVLA